MAAFGDGPGERMLPYRSSVDGAPQTARCYLPLRPRRRYPVLVVLHGYGGPASRPGPTACRLADALGWVLLSPDGRGNQHWDGPGETDLDDALAALASRLRLDPERLYLSGGSMGGHGALRLGLRWPHRFAAVAAVAGWITAEQFYPKWYAPPRVASPPAAIAPYVAAAAPGSWRHHACWVPGRLAFGTADRVNEAEDTEWLIAWLRQQGWYGPGGWEAARVADGGHGAGANWLRTFRFCARHRRTWPRALRALDLRSADGGWFRAERLVDPLQPAEFSLRWRAGEAVIGCRNVAEVTVEPGVGPPPLACARVCRVTLGGEADGARPLTIGRGEAATVTLTGAGGRFAKRRGVTGPIGELFRQRFLVVAPPSGPHRDAAERFCADWNCWFTHRYTCGEPRPEARGDWWRQPAVDWPSHCPDPAGLIRPVRPAAAEAAGCHLVVFGSPADCPLTRRFAEWPGELAVRPLADGIACGGERYQGDRIGYWALHPQPWRPDRLILLARGYQHSGLNPVDHAPRLLGKDLERLPWGYPDLAVWDTARECRLTVQPPLRHLPDQWLLAATLDGSWGWAGARVHRTPGATGW